MVLLGAEAGLRIGETVALEQSDVDYRRGYILVQRAEYRGHIGIERFRCVAVEEQFVSLSVV